MERGLYAAAAGMLTQQALLDNMAQNVANVTTVAFKEEVQTFRSLQSMAISRLQNGTGRGPHIGELGTGVAPDKVYIDWEVGALARTGNPLDAALGKDQFFAVRTPGGERYTRAGNLMLDGAGNLLTAAGKPLLDSSNQPINVGGRRNIALDGTGNLTAGGQIIAKLKIVQADTDQLVKDGDSLYRTLTPAAIKPAARPELLPGMLEQSNVNAVGDIMDVIMKNTYEMCQRALTTQDELLKKAATEIGKV